MTRQVKVGTLGALLALSACAGPPPVPVPALLAGPSATATPPPAVPSTLPTAAPAAAPGVVTVLDVTHVPHAVAAGLEVQLAARVEGDAPIRWRLAAGSEGRARLTPDGRFTGMVPGPADVEVDGGGAQATMRLAILAPAAPARLVATSWIAPFTGRGLFVIEDPATWDRLWRDAEVDLSRATGRTQRLEPPAVDFRKEAVLAYTAGYYEDGNPYLGDPMPLVAATSPRLEVVMPERTSEFGGPLGSAPGGSERTLLWAIPREHAGNEAVVHRGGRLDTPAPGVPPRWLPPVPAPTMAPTPYIPPGDRGTPAPGGQLTMPPPGPLRGTPEGPCVGDRITLTATGFARTTVALRLQVGAAGPGVPGRILAVSPARPDGGIALAFTLPPTLVLEDGRDVRIEAGQGLIFGATPAFGPAAGAVRLTTCSAPGAGP